MISFIRLRGLTSRIVEDKVVMVLFTWRISMRHAMLIASLCVFFAACSKMKSDEEVVAPPTQTEVIGEEEVPTSSQTEVAEGEESPVGGVLGQLIDYQDDRSAKEESLDRFGIYILGLEVPYYRILRPRLIENHKLATAFKAARVARVGINLGEVFKTSTRSIDINVNASDEDIIAYLQASIPTVVESQAKFLLLETEAQQFGIGLLLPLEAPYYLIIRERLAANSKLAEALRAVEKAGLLVDVGNVFSTDRHSHVVIDVYIKVPNVLPTKESALPDEAIVA